MPTSPVPIVRNLRIPIPGDLSLAADLYSAAGESTRPAIVVALPYLKDGVAGSALAWFLERFALAGFNVLLVDLQGCGASQGRAREPFDSADADDGVAAVEWAARQSWCDGRVGFWGASYGGIMALRTAARSPSALRAIVAIECASNAGSEFAHPGGIRGGMSPAAAWPTGDLLMQLLPPLHRDTGGDWSRTWKQRLEEVRPRLFDYLRRPPADRYWNANAIDVEAIAVPSLIVAGWRDFFCAASLAIHRRLRAPKQLIVGPWSHLMPDQSPVAPIDLTSLAIRWWKRWLLDKPDAVDREAEVTAYVQGREHWHGFESWPPPRVTRREWIAGHDGLLATSARAFTPVAQTVDPTTGFRDQLWGFPIPGLPQDSREDDRAGLSFTSLPLDEALVIAGAPRVRISVGANSEGIAWVAARLSVVDAAGTSRLVCSGASPREASAFTIPLTNTCFEVARGQRLRLAVSAADFPRLWPQADARNLELDAPPQLELPLLALDDSSRVSPPLHAPDAMLAPLALSLVPEWSVSEDLLSSTVTLTLGQTATMHTPEREGTLELSSRLSTSVSRLAPGASSVTGIGCACARWAQAPEIVVEAQLHVTLTTAEAHATIREGDALIFERTWTLDEIPQ